MTNLRERYNCHIGYSGHEVTMIPCVLAAMMGAVVIERHITLDHNMWGTDQNSSLEIDGMDKLIRRLSIIESIFVFLLTSPICFEDFFPKDSTRLIVF